MDSKDFLQDKDSLEAQEEEQGTAMDRRALRRAATPRASATAYASSAS